MNRASLAALAALCVLSTPVLAEVVLEADDNAATLSGTWTQSTAVAGFYGSDFATAPVGGTAETARFFSPRNITTSGTWCVQAHWTAGSNRSAAARYELYDGATLRTSVNVDQRVNGGAWRTLACVALTAGQRAEARLRDTSGTAGALVVADGVRWVWEETSAQSLCLNVAGGQAAGGGTFVLQGASIPPSGVCKPLAGFLRTGSNVIGYSSGAGCTSSDGRVFSATLATTNPGFFGRGTIVSDHIRICPAGATNCPVAQADASSYFGQVVAERVSCTSAMLSLPAAHN